MLTLRIAFRNLFRQRRRSLFTGLTMVGGFVLLSFAFSMVDGTYGSVIKTFTTLRTGHVQVHQADYLDSPSIYKTLEKPEALMSYLTNDDRVLAWSPRVYGTTLAFVDSKTTAMRLLGVDPERETATTSVAQQVSQGKFLDASDPKGVVIGSSLARLLKAGLGDELVLVTQAADGSIANDLFTIRGILGESGSGLDGMTGYMLLSTAQDFLVLPNRIHEVAMVLRDYRQSQVVAQDMTRHAPSHGWTFSPWSEVEKAFYRAMMADKQGSWVTLTIIIAIVGIGVLNAVLMTILERTREYGVLKAVGTRPGTIVGLIVLETSILAVFSILVGSVLALALNAWFAKYGIQYPEPIDVGGIMVERMRGAINAACFWVPTVVTLGTAMVVSVLPAIRAARVNPVQAMRTH